MGRLVRARPALLGQALGQENFQQRLVGHVALIRQRLQVLDHGLGQPDGDRAQGWL